MRFQEATGTGQTGQAEPRAGRPALGCQGRVPCPAPQGEGGGGPLGHDALINGAPLTWFAHSRNERRQPSSEQRSNTSSQAISQFETGGIALPT